MEINKIEDNSDTIEKEAWPLSKDEQTLAANLALGQAFLCSYDELSHTKHFKHRLKQTGKAFTELLEKEITPLNDLVFSINSDNKFNECVGAYEWMVEFMAKTDPEKFLEAINELKEKHTQ